MGIHSHLALAAQARKDYTITKKHEDIGRAIDHLEESLACLCVTAIEHERLRIDMVNLLLIEWAQFPSGRDWSNITKAKELMKQVEEIRNPHKGSNTVDGAAESVVGLERAIESSQSDIDQGDFLDLLIQSHEEFRHVNGEFLGSEAFIRSCTAYLRATCDQQRILTALKMAFSPSLADWVAEPEIPFCQNALGELLRLKYTTLGNPRDIERARELSDQAFTKLPADPDTSLNRACILGCEWQESGDVRELDESMRRLKEVYDMADDSTLRSSASNNIALLNERYANSYEPQARLEADLRRAFQAVEASESPITRASSLNRVGVLSARLYEATSNQPYLTDAISSEMTALTVDPTHSLAHQHLDRLTTWLSWEYKDKSQLDSNTLDNAITIARSQGSMIEANDAVMASVYSNQCRLFRLKYESTGLSYALQQSVLTGQSSLRKAPADSAARLQAIQSITKTVQYEANPLSMDRLLTVWREALSTVSFPPISRVNLAVDVLQILKTHKRHGTALEMARLTIGLLAKADPQSVQGRDRRHILERCAGLASDAAAFAFETNPTEEGALEALALLEEGRGILADYHYEGQQSITRLKAIHPTEASEYRALVQNLNHAQPDPHLYNGQEEQFRAADKHFQGLVHRIRAFDGFEMFLRPPTVEQMCEIAKKTEQTIVVINVSFRCDAFLIHKGHVMVVEQLAISEDIIRRWVSDWNHDDHTKSYSALRELWTHVTLPILTHLDLKRYSNEDRRSWPRICWIPTRILIGLPLHAAGCYLTSKQTVLDYAASSYSASIKALIHSQQYHENRLLTKPTPVSTIDTPHSALLVSMPHTPGHGSLLFTELEVDMVSKLLHPPYDVPTQAKRARLDLLNNLRRSDIFHFAGHGRVDRRDGSQSALILEDANLTVMDLQSLDLHLTLPRLAYLSACSTGVSASTELIDEAIHLVGACQMAGYQNVIGTLWKVSDRLSMQMAVAVYQNMVRCEQPVFLALHDAVLKSRDGNLPAIDHPEFRHLQSRSASDDEILEPSHPRMWAAYIHMGR